MKRARWTPWLALAGLVGLIACEQGSVEPTGDTALALQIRTEPGLASLADAGRVHIEGPTNRTVSIAPGETQTIDGLDPGSYSVTLEAFLGGQVESMAQTSVTVAAGQTATANLSLQSFVPTNVSAPPQALAGQAIAVQFQGVTGATNYRVEWDDDPGFSSPQSTDVSGSPASITISEEGTFHVRVRARNRFGSTGLPATPSEVQVSPPVTPLEHGEPVTDRSGTTGSVTYFTFEVPSGGAKRVLHLVTLGTSGDADLFVKRGAQPTLDDFLCASELGGSVELCAVVDPEPGTWHVMVYGFAAYEGLSIEGRLLELRALENGTPVGNLSGVLDDFHYFEFVVPGGSAATAAPAAASAPVRNLQGNRVISGSIWAGALGEGAKRPARASSVATGPEEAPVEGTLTLTTGGGSGNTALLGTPAAPTFNLQQLAEEFACVDDGAGNTASCEVQNPESGSWIVVLAGVTQFSGVTLEAEFTGTGNDLGVTATGSGSVTGGPIDCTFTDGAGSGTCFAAASGDVTLTATAAPGFQFDGWSGEGCSGTGTCTVSMTQDRSVHADFAPLHVAPLITDAQTISVEIQSNFCSDSGTLFSIRLDYSDANGNVPSPPDVQANFLFIPSGQGGTDIREGVRNGTGESGYITVQYCVVYGNETELRLDLSTFDAVGLQSNEVSLSLPKPDGSAAPPVRGRDGVAEPALLRTSGG